MQRLAQIFLWIFPLSLFATYFGNPEIPYLQTQGIIKETPSWCCLRVGYMADCLYRQSYKDEFKISTTTNPATYTKITTDASVLVLNFKNWIDISALIGSSQLQVEREVFAKSQLAWGIGTKFLLYRLESLCFSADFKYFETNQKPLYFLSEGRPYNILSNFKLNYTEWQGALGIAYKNEVLCPYIWTTYIYSKLEPQPYTVIVQMPFSDMQVDTVSKSVVSNRRLGLAVGATLLGGSKGSLTIESRFFNQNAINISGEIRF